MSPGELMTWKIALVGFLVMGAIVLATIIALAVTDRKEE